MSFTSPSVGPGSSPSVWKDTSPHFSEFSGICRHIMSSAMWGHKGKLGSHYKYKKWNKETVDMKPCIIDIYKPQILQICCWQKWDQRSSSTQLPPTQTTSESGSRKTSHSQQNAGGARTAQGLTKQHSGRVVSLWREGTEDPELAVPQQGPKRTENDSLPGQEDLRGWG